MHGNLFTFTPADDCGQERFDTLLKQPGLLIERIVSTGQASAPGYWFDQSGGEWVLLLSGEARLRFEDEDQARHLRPGDWLHIAPHRRHRVDWTPAGQATVWLAVHYRDPAQADAPGDETPSG